LSPFLFPYWICYLVFVPLGISVGLLFAGKIYFKIKVTEYNIRTLLKGIEGISYQADAFTHSKHKNSLCLIRTIPHKFNDA
jgi:hypothetical protein